MIGPAAFAGRYCGRHRAGFDEADAAADLAAAAGLGAYWFRVEADGSDTLVATVPDPVRGSATVEWRLVDALATYTRGAVPWNQDPEAPTVLVPLETVGGWRGRLIAGEFKSEKADRDGRAG